MVKCEHACQAAFLTKQPVRLKRLDLIGDIEKFTAWVFKRIENGAAAIFSNKTYRVERTNSATPEAVWEV